MSACNLSDEFDFGHDDESVDDDRSASSESGSDAEDDDASNFSEGDAIAKNGSGRGKSGPKRSSGRQNDEYSDEESFDEEEEDDDDSGSDDDASYEDENTRPNANKSPAAAKSRPSSAGGKRKSNASSSSAKQEKSIEETYQKKTQLEHILLRPDTYIGSVEPLTQPMFVLDAAATDRIRQREITFTPGFYKIFDEIVVNAADNKQRDPTMDRMEVNFDADRGIISVLNNGKGIPIHKHKDENCYVATMIFGQLLTVREIEFV